MVAGLAWSTYASVAGGPGRWTLADDSRGLDSMAAMYATVNTMASQITLFTTLQGLTLLLLILRLISFLSAQKRLSILTTTAVKVSIHVAWSRVLCMHPCACATSLIVHATP